jgi:hypothetical protein
MMLPVIEAFMAAHHLPDVTVVADAGMISEANQKQIEAAGLSFILGAKIPYVPYAVAQWRREHPGEQVPDGHVFTQPWPAGPNGGRRDQVIFYQYRHDRARRTLRGIDEQVKKAEQAVTGKAPVKRNRFIQLSGGTRSVNRELEEKARALAGIKGYVTNLRACPDGTEAHLTVVFAALTVSRWIENQTGWSIRKFVKTARRYSTIQIQAGPHAITTADPLPDDLRQALGHVHGRSVVH